MSSVLRGEASAGGAPLACCGRQQPATRETHARAVPSHTTPAPETPTGRALRAGQRRHPGAARLSRRPHLQVRRAAGDTSAHCSVAQLEPATSIRSVQLVTTARVTPPPPNTHTRTAPQVLPAAAAHPVCVEPQQCGPTLLPHCADSGRGYPLAQVRAGRLRAPRACVFVLCWGRGPGQGGALETQ